VSFAFSFNFLNVTHFALPIVGMFDVKRIERLLNITREEIARDYTTNAEVQRITDHIDQRFNRLEAKIDQLIQAGK